MKKIKYISVVVVSVLALCSCSEKKVEFGTVKYYPKFLWVDAKSVPVEKTFDFDFSQDAKNDNHCFAEFLFVDNDDKPISTDVMQVSVDGKPVPENRLRINSSTQSLKVSFMFSPQAKEKTYQGYLCLANHNLDRLDNEILAPGQKINVLQWTLDYDKQMNLLAEVLMWIFILVCGGLLIWFLIIKKIIYPCFQTFTKSILVEKDGQKVEQMSVAFKGARLVFFSDKPIKQSFWNRLFTGEIRTVVRPQFTSKLKFSPKKKNALVSGEGYSVRPNPIPRSGLASIEHMQQKLKITIR